MNDTATKEGREKRIEELVEGHKKTGNRIGIVRLIGGTPNDMNDYIPGYDDGEEPKGSYQN